jgi:hypothetical protein
MPELAGESAKPKRKKRRRGPAHAWDRWNQLPRPQRLAVLEAFKEGYEEYPIAAFASEPQAEVALWKLLAKFQNAVGWRDQPFIDQFAIFRGYLTPILEREPYATAITKGNRQPPTVSASEAWTLQYDKSENAGGDAYNNLSVKANAGFDAFHTWIIENNKLGLAASIRGILPFPISGILKDRIHRALSWALSSWIKGITAILALVISILAGHYLISYEGCAQQLAKNKDVTDEQSDKEKIRLLQRTVSAKENVDADSGDARLASTILQECARLPPGPDRKECLINLANASRGNFERAEHIYKMAIADSYRPEGVGKRHIGRYWHFGLSWPDEAGGDELLKAQNHNALLALTTLYARADKFSPAFATWKQSIDLVSGGGSAFGEGIGDCGTYVLAFLNRKAGFLNANRSYDAHLEGCLGQLEFESALLREVNGELTDSLVVLANAYAHLYIKPQETFRFIVKWPETDIQWKGILPETAEIQRHVRDLHRRIIDQMSVLRRAIEVDDTAIVLNPSGTLIAALFQDAEPFCVRGNRPPDGSWPNHWSVVIDVGDKKREFLSPFTSTHEDEHRLGDATLNTSKVNARVFWTADNKAPLTWRECEDRRVEASVCRMAGGMWLLPAGQSCQ